MSMFAARRRLSLAIILPGFVGLPLLAGTSQTISFDAIPNQILGLSPFPIAARATSGLPISLASNIPAVCKTAEDLVILVSVGTCSITASQGGNATYNPAPSVTKTFTVVEATASINSSNAVKATGASSRAITFRPYWSVDVSCKPQTLAQLDATAADHPVGDIRDRPRPARRRDGPAGTSAPRRPAAPGAKAAWARA